MSTGLLLRVATTVAALLVMAGALPGVSCDRAQAEDYPSIMAPEPGVPPKYRSPRGLPRRPKDVNPRPLESPPVEVAKPAPPVILPNGRAVPNLPPVRQGIVPGGRTETFGDRAARCAHQSALYGVPAAQRHNYMHSCTQ